MSSSNTIVAASPSMTAVLAQVRRAAETDETVLLIGESGTGKELLARTVHDSSSRARGPFVAINCGALPEAMVEAILFGYERGAFTGATSRRDGKFMEASKGTLFLDEIGEVSPAMQVKLLRALQEREVEPLGGQAAKVDVRVVAATNRDLVAMMQRGQFREDLYYRLDVLKIRVPPLRERHEDIPPLVEAFLAEAGPAGRVRLDAAALAPLVSYGWPGNIRQLQNFVKKLVHAVPAPAIGAADVKRLLREAEPSPAAAVVADRRALGQGAETRPSATATTGAVGHAGLAIAWWRFTQATDADERLYLCDVDALERAERLASVPLDGGLARIGREQAQVSVRLDSGEVSRVHATIRVDGADFTLEDEGSRNHTYVDGRELGRGERVPLGTGSVLRIGKEWLGIAIALEGGGLPQAPLAPMLFARAAAQARGRRRVRIDIKAMEAICARGFPPDEADLTVLATRLCAEGGPGVIEKDQVPEPGARGTPATSDWKAMSRDELLALVAMCGGNKREAARRLGISPTTLWKLLKDEA